MMDKLISQQAAINAVSEITTTMSVCTNKDECCGMKRMQKQAITELENLPSAEPESISEWKKEFREYVDSLDIAKDDWKGIIEYINDVPTVQPVRKGTRLSTVCLLCKKPAVTFNTEDDIPYTNYSYCEDCLRKGLKLLREQKKNSQAQPERKTGHWIPVTNGRGGHQCDKCGCYAPSYQSGTEWLSNFCPECNADMRGKK